MGIFEALKQEVNEWVELVLVFHSSKQEHVSVLVKTLLD